MIVKTAKKSRQTISGPWERRLSDAGGTFYVHVSLIIGPKDKKHPWLEPVSTFDYGHPETVVIIDNRTVELAFPPTSAVCPAAVASILDQWHHASQWFMYSVFWLYLCQADKLQETQLVFVDLEFKEQVHKL